MRQRKGIAIEYVAPETLVRAPYNPREIGDAALRRLATLIDSHGWVDPIIARREDRLVIGGHQRLRANLLREQPDTQVPVVFLDDVDDAQAKALNIALNNGQAQGNYDWPKLADVLQGIDTALRNSETVGSTSTGELDIPALTGFGTDDLAGLMDGLGPDISRRPPGDIEVAECFQVAAECETEQAQRELYERLTAEGYTCRLLVL